MLCTRICATLGCNCHALAICGRWQYYDIRGQSHMIKREKYFVFRFVKKIVSYCLTLTNVLCTDYIVLMMHFTYPLVEVDCSLACSSTYRTRRVAMELSSIVIVSAKGLKRACRMSYFPTILYSLESTLWKTRGKVVTCTEFCFFCSEMLHIQIRIISSAVLTVN